MTDAVWTEQATEQAVALWIEGRDPAEIASRLGTSVAEVIGRVAQAALARQARPAAPARPAARAVPAGAEPAPTPAPV
ncbi:GcrA family cell cycle regulator, partial [Methylobacterium crusticola]